MEDLTYLMFVLDRSGSMTALRNAVVTNFNKLIAEQQQVAAPCRVSLVQFDDKYEENYLDVPLSEVQPLTLLTYEPRGSTALFDAVGRSVTSLGTRIDRLPVKKRPQRVIVVVHTDGAENASKEFKAEQVQALVKANSDEGGWMFIFAGANIDAFAAGGDLGLARGGIANYVGHAQGTQALYGATSQAVMRSRTMGQAKYASAVRGMSKGESVFNAAELRAMATGDASQMSQIASQVTVPPASAPISSAKKSPKRPLRYR